jgi:hypothetical protein
MIQRGYTPVLAPELWGERHNATNVVLVVDHLDDAVRLRGLARALVDV